MPIKYEDCSDLIETQIEKRRFKWKMSGFGWMEFEDAAQLIRTHIHKKIHLFDESKKIEPWLNRIITNQIRNLIRNNFSNYVKPCFSCAASQGDDLCSIYKTQCAECPLYAKWEKARKYAYNVKRPASSELHLEEIESRNAQDLNIEKTAENLHKRMKKVLNSHDWAIYELLYIKQLDTEEAALKLGYKTSEKNRTPGYKRISNAKKSIIEKVRQELYSENVDIV